MMIIVLLKPTLMLMMIYRQAGILREIEERPLVNRLLPVGKKGLKQQQKQNQQYFMLA